MKSQPCLLSRQADTSRKLALGNHMPLSVTCRWHAKCWGCPVNAAGFDILALAGISVARNYCAVGSNVILDVVTDRDVSNWATIEVHNIYYRSFGDVTAIRRLELLLPKIIYIASYVVPGIPRVNGNNNKNPIWFFLAIYVVCIIPPHFFQIKDHTPTKQWKKNLRGWDEAEQKLHITHANTQQIRKIRNIKMINPWRGLGPMVISAMYNYSDIAEWYLMRVR